MFRRTLSRRAAATAIVSCAGLLVLPALARAASYDFTFSDSASLTADIGLVNHLGASDTWTVTFTGSGGFVLSHTLNITSAASGQIIGNGAVITGAFNDGFVLQSSNSSITGLELKGFNDAVLLGGANDSLFGTSLHDNQGAGVAVTGSGAAIHDNTLKSNLGNEIDLNGASDATITHNTITNSRPLEDGVGRGVSIVNSLRTVVDQNDISSSANGVYVSGSQGTSITGNTLTSNYGNGIYLTSGATGSNVTGNVISGGFGDGVSVDKQSSANTIVLNTIKSNDGNGVTLTDANLANPVLRNSIFNNDELGIDVADLGPTPNSSSPFDHQNFPEIASASVFNGQITIMGGLSAPSGSYHLEFFANDEKDPSGYGEGQTYLGSLNVAPGSDQTWTIASPLLQPGQWLTATATSLNGAGSTSEFSLAVIATLGTGSGGGLGDNTGGAVVPLPSSAWAGLLLLGLLGASRLLPRRRKA